MVALFLRLLLSLAGALPGSVEVQITVQRRDGTAKKDYAGVVVYLADARAGGPAHGAEIRQAQRRFVPSVLTVPAGTRVAFPNDDALEHNVFSHSAAADFDLGRFARGPGKTVAFDRVGVAEIFCNVHKEMVSYVVVTPGAASTITGPDGRFVLKGVPAGPHRLVIWHRFARPKLIEVQIEVAAGKPLSLTQLVREAVDAEPAHKNKFGVDYGAGYK